MNMMEINIGKNFKLTRKLGNGAFGEIFHAINVKNNMEVAIKIEQANTQHPQIFYETNVYKYLLQETAVLDKGIPQVYFCSNKGDYNIMVMDLMGPSLEDLFNIANRKLGLKTTLMLAQQILVTIEYVHSRKFLHRDIKPDNFLIGTGKRAHKIFLIDFGLAKKYMQKDGSHIPYRDGKSLTGTARYASLNTHLGIEQARRDDLESIGFVLMYFLRGSLPWQNLRAKNKKEKYEKIKLKKLETTTQQLCQGFPEEFVQYFNYCKQTQFEAKPDYDYLRQLFKDLFLKNNFEYDYNYDWVPKLAQKEDEKKVLAKKEEAT